MTGLHPGRAPTIVAGVVILIQVMRAFGLHEIEVSEHDILYGAALEAAGVGLSRLAPIYAAIAIFPLIAAGAALPYVALQYRRNGTLGAGQLLLAGLFGLYLVGLAFTVVLPLRPVSPEFCDVFGVNARLDPFHVFDHVSAVRRSGGLSAVLHDPDVQDLPLNVLLFVPLGMFVRHLLNRGFLATVAIGAGVSFFIELTQLTGDWGLYPCAYRYFSTADLITNTIGAGIGAFCAPLLALIPARGHRLPWPS